MNSKIMNVEKALDLIKDGDAIVSAQAGAVGNPNFLLKKLGDRYLERKSPKGLTMYSGCGHNGDDNLAHPGLLSKFVGSHPGPSPGIMGLIEKNEMEAYGIPQGILQQLYRCSSARQAGILSKVGMGTYIDSRQDGGRLNSAAKGSVCELMQMGGEDWLFYKSFPINIAFVRATTADEAGNLTIEEEALKLEILEIALAAKATGGKVIAQVKRIAARGTLKAKDVIIPGEIVDAIVLVEEPEVHHRQTKNFYNPYLSGEMKSPAGAVEPPPEVLGIPDIVCRRATCELYPGAVVNIGLGVGAGIPTVAAVENMTDQISFTLELGTFGGTPTPKSDFGAAINPTSFVAHPTMFDFYHGGGLDIAFLGAAEIDKEGNVNVSRFGELKSGRAQGGFIDISSCAGKVVFCTQFRAAGLKATVENGNLQITKEGREPKFVDKVNQITFNGRIAVEAGKEVVFVTERCVFTLTKNGIELTEIAPGIDLQKDILDNMGFKPVIPQNLKTMDPRVFKPGRMGIFDGV